MSRRSFKKIGLIYMLLGGVPMPLIAGTSSPWMDSTRSPDERASLAVQSMTLEEELSMVHGIMPIPGVLPEKFNVALPADAIHGAGYVPGVPRLGVPALHETDASLGVTNPFNTRPGDVATALPAGLSIAASFDPDMAFKAGSTIGAEAHSKGFNVLLGGGVDLTRDPRNGRNFEYLGEDPYLAGLLAGQAIRGTQSEHVVSTIKHYALNANETNRTTLDARIDPKALQESDLLAFQIAIEKGAPGSVMCGYNKVNGIYDCGNGWLLNDVLKQQWGYKGWVMSDWGAVHSVDDAKNGLDQESGEQLDEKVFFGEPLREAIESKAIPKARLDDMVKRILRSLYSVGVTENPAGSANIDYAQHAQTALALAQEGTVLLKNANGFLPFANSLDTIAVIGGHANAGVLSGSGSSQVTPANGAVIIPLGGDGIMAAWRNESYFKPSPLAALKQGAPTSKIFYDPGVFPEDAAALARRSKVAVVFVTRHELEGYDSPNLKLPYGQDALVEAVAAANPNTLVVIEAGNPVEMPWVDKVRGVIMAWYPGEAGGQAIADLIFGKVNPSGHLPITFPVHESDFIRPQLPNLGAQPGAAVSIDYSEGADVGYRRYLTKGITPLFPFGYGLSYTEYKYSNLRIHPDATMKVTVDVENVGSREGTDVPQLYLASIDGVATPRLLGFKRVTLKPGEKISVELHSDRRLWAQYQDARKHWDQKAGQYDLYVGHYAGDTALTAAVHLPHASF